jgi:hypothetical protein
MSGTKAPPLLLLSIEVVNFSTVLITNLSLTPMSFENDIQFARDTFLMSPPFLYIFQHLIF